MRYGVEIELLGQTSKKDFHSYLQSKNVNMAPNTDLEIEKEELLKYWRLHDDASVVDHDNFRLRGIELVSPALDWSADNLKETRRVFDLLSGPGHYYVNNSCGLHVHFEMAPFIKNMPLEDANAFIAFLAKKYADDEELFDAMVTNERRKDNNRYCRTLKGKHFSKMIKERYFKLNVSAYTRHGTVEFRHHHGTLSGEKALTWMKCCYNFIYRVFDQFNCLTSDQKLDLFVSSYDCTNNLY